MPIYEYSCTKCNEVFALFQSINASEKEARCPKCGTSDVKKMLSSFSCGSFGSGGLTSFGSLGGHGGT